MVRTTHYCGICDKGYLKKSDALACEKQGIIGVESELGKTFKKTNLRNKPLYEQLLIILKREKVDRMEFRHHITYKTADMIFSDNPSSWDDWSFGIKT